MAPPKMKVATARFFVATLLMSMVLLPSPGPVRAHEDRNCFPLQGKPCEQQGCSQLCKAQGFVNPDARCGHPPPGKGGNGEYCCCYPQ
ncbi:hypothetical protein BS78_07G050400 [Paspalum vaginatum]|nr:hypothetical protein BS78_07G050400 [Paspalum vaginatum]